MSNDLTPSTSGSSPSPQQSQTAPEIWITAAEAASVLHLSLRTVLSRAASGKLPARIPDDMPFTYDGKQNYLIRLEGLPQKAQFEYLQKGLPASQRCGLDLATPRSSFGDVWLSAFLDVAQLIRDAEQIRQRYRHSGKATAELRRLAAANGISLSTLYRLCGKPSSKELSMLFLDPVYLQHHLPKTMCLWSADLAYALYLDHHQHFSQNSIFRELEAHGDILCSACPYYPGNTASLGTGIPVCKSPGEYMRIPHNRRTVNRLLAHIPPQMVCYCREGVRKWNSLYGHFALREKPLLVNELWQGDHHVFDLFVRITVKCQSNGRTFEKEIAVRPTLTAWMDTATGCIVGWVISILPNADTIAEAFCRAAALTQAEIFHGLPKAILVDCGKDYRSALLEDLPDEISSIPEDALYLNKRFAGLGLLPALGVEVHHALPYHPQSKSIERMFGTLEREWICKLKGWCHNSVKERPDGFSKRLQQLLEKKELLTMDAFVQKFQSEILPGYHQFHKAGSTPGRAETKTEGWRPSFDSMSPLEKYNALEKPYLVTPDWKTLCALKLHRAANCRIGRHGIRFQNVWYWDDALRGHIGSSADVFYHFVEKPFAPSSLTVTVSGRFVCEAFPAQKLPFTGADPAELQSHIDGNRQHEKELKETITRINRSAAAILPPEASASTVSEKAHLRDHCYAASVTEQASAPSDSAPPLPDDPENIPGTDAASKISSPSAVQEFLNFLFGESSI